MRAATLHPWACLYAFLAIAPFDFLKARTKDHFRRGICK